MLIIYFVLNNIRIKMNNLLTPSLFNLLKWVPVLLFTIVPSFVLTNSNLTIDLRRNGGFKLLRTLSREVLFSWWLSISLYNVVIYNVYF